jgi:hypothetical protein
MPGGAVALLLVVLGLLHGAILTRLSRAARRSVDNPQAEGLRHRPPRRWPGLRNVAMLPSRRRPEPAEDSAEEAAAVDSRHFGVIFMMVEADEVPLIQ